MSSPVKLSGPKQQRSYVPAAQPAELDLDGAWLDQLERKSREPADVRDSDLGRLAEFTHRVVMLGEPPIPAGRSLGWSPPKVRRLMQSRVYADVRAQLLAAQAQSLEQRATEIHEVIHDTAYQGALKQNEIVRTSEDMTLVNKVANTALDRVGYRAPEKKQTKVVIELSPESAALFAKAKADRQITQAIDLERDFGFATARPKLDDERAKDKIGTGYLPPPEEKS